jgi:uncharacterized integral membrane protein
MTFGYLVVALIATAVTVFAIQNSAPTAVEFLVWKREGMPVSALILVSFGAGLVLAGVPLAIQRWRLRARVRALETRVRMLETAVEDRTRAVLGQPPPPGRPPAAEG